jgi:hypothetical protein
MSKAGVFAYTEYGGRDRLLCAIRPIEWCRWRRLKSHRRKFRKGGERSARGSRRSPPRLVANDPIHVNTTILLVGFDSGFGLRPEVTIDSARISGRG